MTDEVASLNEFITKTVRFYEQGSLHTSSNGKTYFHMQERLIVRNHGCRLHVLPGDNIPDAREMPKHHIECHEPKENGTGHMTDKIPYINLPVGY